MDAFGKFLVELADHESVVPPTPVANGFARTTEDSPRARRLLEQIRESVLQEAVFVAASAGVANALEQRVPGVGRQSITVALPDESFYRQLLPQLALETDICPELMCSLQELTARTSLARRMSRAFVEVTDADTPVDPELLSDAWRRAAKSAIVATERLERAARDAGMSNVSSVDQLIGLLQSATGGEPACLDPDGRVSIPGWAERRRAPRAARDLQIAIDMAGKAYRSTLKDISASGAGLEGELPGSAGCSLILQLPGGRRLRAVMAWNSGQRFGVRFEEVLKRDDPLLWAKF